MDKIDYWNPSEWNAFPYKDKVVNQKIYQVAEYHKVENPDLKEILSHFDFAQGILTISGSIKSRK